MSQYLKIAEQAARAAGDLLRENFGREQEVDAYEAHDIKLALDVRCQDIITEIILAEFPDHTIVGEEGDAGIVGGEVEWIVDPIDGTVNYFFGIPQFCVSIAWRRGNDEDWVGGLIYEPMLNEMWTVNVGEKAHLNGIEISASQRAELKEAVVMVGFSKTKESMDAGFQRFKTMAYQVRKTRMLGSAALAMAYISTGRLDAYIEEIISLWDIAAGRLLVEAAGGQVNIIESPVAPGKLSICAWNGLLPLSDALNV